MSAAAILGSFVKGATAGAVTTGATASGIVGASAGLAGSLASTSLLAKALSPSTPNIQPIQQFSDTADVSSLDRRQRKGLASTILAGGNSDPDPGTGGGTLLGGGG